MKKRLALLLAMVMVLGTFIGCASNKEDNGEITLTWYARINKEVDSAEVFQKASDYTKEKLGVALDIIALEDYHTKMAVINASGEDFDIVYTSSAVNNIFQNVEDGNLLAIDELLPEYAPELWAQVDKDIWEGMRINGKIYGVPNMQIMARFPGYMMPTQNIKLLGIDLEKDKFEKLEDYESYFKAIKEKTGSYAYLPSDFGPDGQQAVGFEQILGTDLPGSIRFEDENPVVFNQYETQEFKDHMNLRTKWVREGLLSPMEVTIDDIPKYLKPENEIMPWLVFANTTKPGVEADMKKNYDVDLTITTETTPLMSTYSLFATVASINSTTRYPEKSVEFLNLLNTDPALYNLILYGIEGTNYTKISENRIELNSDRPYTQPGWAIGNTFNGYLLPGNADDVHERTKAVNDGATRSPILGFVPNQEEIKTEIANCSAVIEEYKLLAQGIMNPEVDYPAFIEKLKVAGADKIIENINKQLEAWKASK